MDILKLLAKLEADLGLENVYWLVEKLVRIKILKEQQ